MSVRYHNSNHHWPETIVVFRDGVSDSQMDTVAQFEGKQFVDTFSHVEKDLSGSSSGGDSSSSSSLRKKFSELGLPNNYSPQLAYIVVKKRISTRIMVRKGTLIENPPPGKR
jgi:aubergine-like protein